MIASNQADFMVYVRAGHFVLMDGAFTYFGSLQTYIIQSDIN